MTSCTSTQVKETDFTEVAAKNEALKTSYTRVKAAVEADCDGSGLCTILESNISALVKLIKGLQDQLEQGAEAHNKVVDALTLEEMAKHREREARQYCEIASKNDKIINTVKSIAQLGICAGGILWK